MFAAEGQFLKTFLSRGRKKEGGPVAPVALAIDAYGLVYVSDNTTNSIYVLSPEGACMASFGKEGRAPGEFKSPCGIMVTEGGVIYVCDFGNDRLQVF